MLQTAENAFQAVLGFRFASKAPNRKKREGAPRLVDGEPHLREYYVIPPEQNAAFVANMEDVLDTYHLPYDPQVPVVFMDEQPVQLIKEMY